MPPFFDLAANASWFDFRFQYGEYAESEDFAVYSFSGHEEVCKPYEFSIELVSRRCNVDITSLLSQAACLSIADRSGEKRLVHGIVCAMDQLHTGNVFTHYRCLLVPRLWFLDQIRDHRIFQNLTVVEIIQQLLKEQGFTAEQSAFNIFYKREPREYCVQYGESDLHFITRLCEEEGIHFYFKHTESFHCLCFCDHPGGPEIVNPDIRFFPGSGQASDTAVISRLQLHRQTLSNAATYRDWNFTQTRLNMEAKAVETEMASAPRPRGMRLEQYQYPHLYQQPDTGRRYADLQLMRQLSFTQWIEAESDVSRYLPGHIFKINGHQRTDINAGWWLFSVRHTGEQPGVLEHEAPSDRGLRYESSITAIPQHTRFIPALAHPKTLVIGDQTALVTGPTGEEIFTDDYGRVQVLFHWDREGQPRDRRNTCWVRVSQGWAGSQYGTIAIPRIGHEVIVGFLEGNPDRPLITGRVNNALHMPPYELPQHKTRTVFKSMSTPGEEGRPRGFNELRIEDKRGQEEIYLHGEKDVNVHVKNDLKEHILHDRHQTAGHCTYVKTEGETHETLKGPRKTELFADDNLTVHGDSHLAVDKNWLVRVGDDVHIKTGGKMVIEADGGLTLKVGGQYIRIDLSAIKTSSMFQIGAGSPFTGTAANPLLPLGSQSTEAGKAPQCPACQLCALKAALDSPCCKKYAPGEEAAASNGKDKAGDPVAICSPKPTPASPELSDKGAEDVAQSRHYTKCPDEVKAEIQNKSFTPEEKEDIQDVLGKMGPLMQCPGQPVKRIGRTNKAISKDEDGCRAESSTMGEWFDNRGAVVLTDSASSPMDFKDSRTQFKGTLAHELTHGLTNGYDPRTCKKYSDWTKNPLMKDWGKAAGWQDNLQEMKEGATWSPTVYGATNPTEDFSESMMLYMYDPDKLKSASVERYDFIKNLFNSL